MPLSRRHFLAASAGGLLLPRSLLAGASPERKFLFLFCRGGWDTSYVFTPLLDYPDLEPEAGAELLEVGGIPFVHNDSRPEVYEFFSSYAHTACVINGLEVRSVTHERCRQLVLTGTSAGGDDWPAVLAANSSRELLFPHLVVAGPAYTAQYTSAVVRVGDNGQLPTLLDGTALETSTAPVSLPAPDIESLTDAFTRARIDQAIAASAADQRQRVLAGYGQAMDNLKALEAYAGELSLESEIVGCRRNNAADAALIFDTFELGLSRCGMIEDQGWCAAGWDTHEGNAMQDWHFQELFASLRTIMADLESRPGEVEARMIDEVTVVVFSEMGRHPQLNSRGGKEHWTYTSAMLLGAGVAGGQVIGGLDDDGQGMAIDLASGASTTSGVSLTGGNLGATLLAMGGLDPGDFLYEIDPITAAMG